MNIGRLGRLAAGVTALGLIFAACTPAGSESKGTVNIAINPWVGYEANAAVVAYLLEKELGYTVVKKDLKEDVSWQGFETGEVDVIIENWGHPDLEKIYIEEKKVAQVAGNTGNVGIIGWYVPKWMVDENPDIVDSANLNRYADLFKTSESGDLGQFLGSDPSYVQYDEALMTNLGLNFKVVFSGSETASVEAMKQADAQKTPLLLYFWDPHWIHAVADYVQVSLPAYTDGCVTRTSRRSPANTRSTRSTRSSAPSSRTRAATPQRSSRTSPGPTRTRTSSPTTSPTRA